MVFRFSGSDDSPFERESHDHDAAGAAVSNALASAYDIDASAITVSVVGSYVVLSGFVRSPIERQRAEEVAGEIVGDDYVRSRLLYPRVSQS